MNETTDATKHRLFASDFDRIQSFNDSGVVQGEVPGSGAFHEKVVGLARVNLVPQAAELTGLPRHSPPFTA